MQSLQSPRLRQHFPWRSPKKLALRKSSGLGQRATVSRYRHRIVLYSHDTMGLGHKRRNLLIAQTLQRSGLPVEILVITGIEEGNEVLAAEGIDYVNLPSLRKNADGSYRSRDLDLSLGELITWRSQLILKAIQQFQPDVLIVDNVPRGVERELDPTLKYIQKQSQTRCVLGLRDVLDNPAAVQRDWKWADNEKAIRRYYDAVWVYGDPQVYDLRQEYGFAPDVVTKMQLLGYFHQGDRLRYLTKPWQETLKTLDLPSQFVLGAVGGGQDGETLAIAFAQIPFTADLPGVLLAGPFMPESVWRKLETSAQQNSHLTILPYCPEPTILMAAAERVITMGGYNTTCEILSFQKPALIIPRIKPRQEQWLRATHLQQLGLVDMLHPNQVNAQNLTAWLHSAPTNQHNKPVLNLRANQKLPLMLAHLLETGNCFMSQAC